MISGPIFQALCNSETVLEGEPEGKEEKRILTFELEFLASTVNGILRSVFISFKDNLRSSIS